MRVMRWSGAGWGGRGGIFMVGFLLSGVGTRVISETVGVAFVVWGTRSVEGPGGGKEGVGVQPGGGGQGGGATTMAGCDVGESKNGQRHEGWGGQ
eukprot:290467-Hanusia_phi.AAC.4